MAAEGSFPKSGGDPLYYSEVNRFAAGVSRAIIGSTAWKTVATYTSAGSVLFNTGSLANPCKIIVQGTINIGTAQSGFATLQLVLSGISNNVNLPINNTPLASGALFFDAYFNVGSSYSGLAYGLYQGLNSQDSRILTSSKTINDLDTSQNTVLDFLLNFGSTGSVQIGGYKIFAIKHNPTGF